MAIEIRNETRADADRVRAINQLAFGRPDEARIVDALRGSSDTISLVATADGGEVVGHILFTPVRIERSDSVHAATGLGPMAVHPDHQRQGIGSALVRAGLEAARLQGHALVVVLGHPAFYSRFGFVPAHTRGLWYERTVPAEAFMAIELRPGASQDFGGMVQYRAEFGR